MGGDEFEERWCGSGGMGRRDGSKR